MDESRNLARWVVGLKYSDLKKRHIDRAKDLILDQLGVELASSTISWNVIVYKYARGLGGPGESTIVNYGDKVKVENAALANATFGHGFEIDDCYMPGNLHPGCVVVPTALAVGERELIDGKSFVLAVVVGYEVMDRIARAVSPSFANRGYHTTPATGPFAAAALTGKILGFNEDTMLNALSIGGSHCGGLGEFTQTSGNVKRVHAGIGASGGVRAALLAQAGLTGPPTVLEGKKGFCRAFSDSYRLEELAARKGEDLLIMQTCIKRYTCCYHLQAPIEATSKIVRENKIKADDIQEVIMGTTQRAMGSVGTIKEPVDVNGCQFSAPFSLAMAVVKGSNGFADYCDANVTDPEIRALAKRVRLEVDKEVEAAYPTRRAIRMTVKLKNGKSYEQWLDGARGTQENPMPSSEIEDKFRTLAAVVLPKKRVEEIIDTVGKLESLTDVSVLARMLVR